VWAEAAALPPALAWLLASVEEERACFEVAVPVVGVGGEELVAAVGAEALAADALVAEPVADAEAGGPELVCFEPAAALAADALVAEPVADAEAGGPEPVCFEPAAAPAADVLVAEPVVGAEVVAAALACSERAEALAVGALAVVRAAEPVAGARVAAARAGPRADSQAVGCDSAAAELLLAQEQALAARPLVRRAVDCDSVEYSAGPGPTAALR
jgi:hypothetical protein